MKAVLGVDIGEQQEAPLELFTRLQFADTYVLVCHSLQMAVPVGMDPPILVDPDLMNMRKAKAVDVVERLCGRLRAAGIPAEPLVVEGDPARLLMEAADARKADLIVTGSERKGNFGSLFFGSTGRGLVIGAHQSVLISKSRLERPGKLTAVLATDHSKYMDECIGLLLRLNPQGIGRIVVITANDVSEEFASLLLEYNVPGFETEVADWAENRLQEKTEEVSRRLQPLGAACESRVIHGDPATAIRQTMESANADLLILGAQGHGFIERMLLGSTALFETVIEPFNTLVLRPSP